MGKMEKKSETMKERELFYNTKLRLNLNQTALECGWLSQQHWSVYVEQTNLR